MGNAQYKIKGMIGNSKPIAILVLLFSGVFFCISAQNVRTAFVNSDRPEKVSIEQIVKGQVGVYKYIEVSGYTNYQFGYTRTKNGTTTESYFALLDRDNGYLLVVQADKPTVTGRRPAEETISGLLYKTPSELKKLIKDDEAKLQNVGFVTNADLYLEENSRPPSKIGWLIAAIVFGVLVLASAITFFFPTVVFAPAPLDLDVPQPANKDNPGVRATGKFIKFKQVQPEIVLDTRYRQFENAVANIIPRAIRDLLIYIHHIERVQTYGVTVHKTESDWGIFLNGENVVAVESGLIYGFKDRRAVRFRYTNDQGQEQQLILSFEYPWSHADAVNLFQKMGFVVETGI